MAKVYNIEDIDAMFTDMEKEITGYLAGMASEYQERAINKAPQKTGALKNSIRAGVNTEVIVFDEKATNGEGAKVANQNAIVNQFKIGDTVNIIVGAPYGKFVEEGTSKQAPQAFLQSAAEELDVASLQVQNEISKYRKG